MHLMGKSPFPAGLPQLGLGKVSVAAGGQPPTQKCSGLFYPSRLSNWALDGFQVSGMLTAKASTQPVT